MTNILMNSLRFPLKAWWRSGLALGYQYRVMEAAAPSAPLVVQGRLPNGCQVECDLSEHVERQIYFRNVYELVEAWLFCSLLKPGMCVVDAGANIGQYSMLASPIVGPTGSVHAFEPVSRNFEKLTSNIGRNGLRNVVTNRTALWREEAELTLGIPEGITGNSGSYSVQPVGTRVRATTLDNYASDLTRLDLIKMDVEGAEGNVLRGARETLNRFKPILLLEVNRTALINAGLSPAGLWGVLESLGYRAWRIQMLRPHCVPLRNLDGSSQFNIVAYAGEAPMEANAESAFESAFRWANGCETHLAGA